MWLRCREAHNGAIFNSEMLDAAGMCSIANQSSHRDSYPLCIHLLSSPLDDEVVEAHRTQKHVRDVLLSKTSAGHKRACKSECTVAAKCLDLHVKLEGPFAKCQQCLLMGGKIVADFHFIFSVIFFYNESIILKTEGVCFQ